MTKRMTREEERDLLQKWREKQDLAARAQLVQALYWFVVKMAVDFDPKHLVRQDLIQEGLEGILIGIDRFDMNQPVRLLTYAAFWVKQRMAEYVYRNRQVVGSKGGHGRKAFWNINRVTNELVVENQGEGFDSQQLATALGVTEKALKEMPREISIDEVSSDSLGERQRKELLLTDWAPGPEEQVARKEETQRVRKGLAHLDRREQLILKKHYGEEPLSLADIGRRLGISRERVRQIENRALQKMRSVLEAA